MTSRLTFFLCNCNNLKHCYAERRKLHLLVEHVKQRSQKVGKLIRGINLDPLPLERLCPNPFLPLRAIPPSRGSVAIRRSRCEGEARACTPKWSSIGKPSCQVGVSARRRGNLKSSFAALRTRLRRYAPRNDTWLDFLRFHHNYIE